jgi:hypothetical protein
MAQETILKKVYIFQRQVGVLAMQQSALPHIHIHGNALGIGSLEKSLSSE